MAVVNEVSTVSHIPQFVPFGLLYYTQDTGDLYIGTGFSTGSDYVGGNPGPNVNVELISSPGGLPGGFNGDIQYNNNGNLGGSAATITAAGAINALSITATSATIGALTATAENIVTSTITSAFVTNETVTTLTATTIVLNHSGAGGILQFINSSGGVDNGISRLGAASLAIGSGTVGSITGNLSYNRINTAGVDHAGQATVTAGNTTKAVTFAANYTGTGQPVVCLTPTSDPLALGVPVGYWVTYSGGAGAWTGFTVNIQTALAGNVTFNYIVVGVA